ncbi:bifunctional diaminohydroxyphosphoribosylaminopyrimidine deaminase/5-amino-6-(5-phosphoribosylamino)uracil reductase RibD [Gemmatimonadota bacterium]
MNEQEAMRRALALAKQGWGRVAPNPMVGAVLLRDGELIGEGYHREFGGDHAEVRALAACEDASGATCVVTLEPCSHHGKTPPCTDVLLASGVCRVSYAVSDPCTKASGGGKLLRAAGVEVERGLEAGAAAALNAPFLWRHMRKGRPFVALKMAASLDGFSTDSAGNSQWISSPEAREHVHWLRAGFDAVGVGRGTAEADDPQLTARGEVMPRVVPKRVVFGLSGTLRSDLELVRTSGDVPTVFFTGQGVAQQAAQLLAGTKVDVIAADDISTALEALRAQGVQSLFVEPGARLAGVMLDAGVVDRIYWIQAPILLGRGAPAFGEITATSLADAPRWVLTERKSLGDSNLLVVDRELCLPE